MSRRKKERIKDEMGKSRRIEEKINKIRRGGCVRNEKEKEIE
jgi:hypothetical protein